MIPPQRLRLVERFELGIGSYGKVVVGILDEVYLDPLEVAVKRLTGVRTHGERVQLAKVGNGSSNNSCSCYFDDISPAFSKGSAHMGQNQTSEHYRARRLLLG